MCFSESSSRFNVSFKAYYVEADGYSENPEDKKEHGISICRKLKLEFIEGLPLQLPSDREMKVLTELCRRKRPMKPIEIVGYLGSQKTPGFENCLDIASRRIARKDKAYVKRINYLMKLNKGILEKLETNGYIKRERVGTNNLVKITEAGIFVAHFSGEL